MLPRKYRLNAKRFNTVYHQGEKFRGKYGMLVALKNENINNPLFGFVVSKKIGNAVYRHHMTRVLHEITYSLLKEDNVKNIKLEFQYISFKYEDKYEEISEDYSKQIYKAIEYFESRNSSN